MLFGADLIVSCAKGASDEDAAVVFVPRVPNAPVQDAGAMLTGGAGGSVAQDASVPMFDGEPCVRGDSQPCACEVAGVMGARTCLANTASPTGGEYSECRNCPVEPADAGDVDPAGGANGMVMSGGMGGAGAGGMSGGAAGSGATGGMSGGAGGTGGASGTGGTATCMCTDLLQCCRDDGSCGIGVPGLCL